MRPSMTTLSAVPCIAAIGLLVAVPLVAQTPPKPAPKSAKAWTPPRTPWGDPDLQGNFTNVYENGTPLERPDQYAGRRLEDVKGDELATTKRAIQKQTVERFQSWFDAP